MRYSALVTVRSIKGLLAGAALVALGAVPAGAQTPAQAAKALYEKTLSREQAAPPPTSPESIEALRAIARSYEGLVRKYPRSGYADNALWQAAGLMEQAFKQSSTAADRDKAAALLIWLQKEYPTSSLARQVTARLAALRPDVDLTKETPGAIAKPAPAVTSAPLPVPPMPKSAAPALAAPAAADAKLTPAATVKNITQSTLPHGDRLIIEVSDEVGFSHDRLANPDRLQFDFPNTSAGAAVADRVRAINSPLVRAVRVNQPTAAVTRVVLELAEKPRYSAFPLYAPFRLVVDVEREGTEPKVEPAQPAVVAATEPSPTVVRTSSTGPAPVAKVSTAGPNPPPAPARTAVPAASSPAPAATTNRGDYSLARQLGLGVSRIVIDAGHGGHDPGAQANGVEESELVLDVALRLQKLLAQQPSVDVVLTRSTDEFIPLEERTAIANREGADLFLSIHANASRQPAAKGIETYFLNFASNPAAEAVAARENAASAQAMGSLPGILKAIALNNKLAESRELATILQASMVRRLRLQNRTTRDLGVKQAPFVVLIGAQMPSVLAEISFVTNGPEAALLKTPAYRQYIAQALYEGVLKYQGSLKKASSSGAHGEK